MTENLCAVCGRPSRDGYVCHPDALRLAEDLREAAGHAEDALTVIARQARYGGGSRAGSESTLPVDLTAADRYAAAENVITTWARHVIEETGRQPAWRAMVGPLCPPTGTRCSHGSCEAIRRQEPPTPAAQAAAWLAMQVGWLRGRPEAREAFDELGVACAVLRRLVDRPADRELVGVCDCGKVLYAPNGRQVVQCPMPTCKLVWHVERSRDILRRHLGDKLVTLPEAARLAAYLDSDRTQDGIRKLLAARAGQLVPHGVLGEDQEAAYVFGDVVALLAGIPKRVRVAKVAGLNA